MRICRALLVADMQFHVVIPLCLGEVVENKKVKICIAATKGNKRSLHSPTVT